MTTESPTDKCHECGVERQHHGEDGRDLGCDNFEQWYESPEERAQRDAEEYEHIAIKDRRDEELRREGK